MHGSSNNTREQNVRLLDSALDLEHRESVDKYLNETYANYLKGLRSAIDDAAKSGDYKSEDIAQLEASYKAQQDPGAKADNLKIWKADLAGVFASFIEGREGGGG